MHACVRACVRARACVCALLTSPRARALLQVNSGFSLGIDTSKLDSVAADFYDSCTGGSSTPAASSPSSAPAPASAAARGGFAATLLAAVAAAAVALA